MTKPASDKPKVISANKSLQAKIGTGPLNEAIVERCQQVMDDNSVDFAPLAKEYLDLLSDAIKKAKEPGIEMVEAVNNMTTPVMQLKANAATFKFNLIGNLANVMLSFLEAVKVLDADAITIVEAHHKTLSAIVKKDMKGDGGEFGKLMEEELKKACKRYYAKTDRK